MFVWKLAVYHLGDDPFIFLLCTVKYKTISDDRMTKYHFFPLLKYLTSQRLGFRSLLHLR